MIRIFSSLWCRFCHSGGGSPRRAPPLDEAARLMGAQGDSAVSSPAGPMP